MGLNNLKKEKEQGEILALFLLHDIKNNYNKTLEAITVTGEGTDWDIEENNGRFKNIDDYIDCFVQNKENVKSVKRISNDTIEIVWYDAEFKGYMKSKCQFCVTKDLIGSVTLDMDVVRKNDADKA